MSVIFNSVVTYVEQVGRRRSIRHWNTLDSLECIYNGPSSTIDDWIPKIGQSHPEYPLFTADSIEVVREVALVTELRVTYVGKFYGMGPVSIGSSSHWGESSWTTTTKLVTPYTTFSQQLVNGILQSVPVTQYAVTYRSYSYICRYLIKTATYKTFSKDPQIIIGKIGDAGILVQNTWQSGASSLDSGMGVPQSNLTFSSDMIDRQVNSLDNGWYEISESWGPQPIITTNIVDLGPPIVVITGSGYWGSQ